MKIIAGVLLSMVAVVLIYLTAARPPAVRLMTGPGEDSALAQVAGCWRFAGLSLRRFGLDDLEVRLGVEGTPLMTRRRALVILDSAMNRRLRLKWWAATSGRDDYLIVWSNGHSGLDVRASLRNDSLVGRAYSTSDFMEILEPPPSRVRASRIACPLEQ